MRPWITITLAVAATAIVLYFQLKPSPAHPREQDFIAAYVELALLSARSDTTSQLFLEQRDSILHSLNFTDSTLWQVKTELNRDPLRVIDVWERIENRLKERRLQLGLSPEPIKE